ncbi:hypothetical protein [Kosakonia cowanii]|jgi:hypothetical protein|uniref:hypothetical protein n=1 Tax=Kosakonia cowanii TaxID=208223 RepID=UPI003D955C9A
MPELFDEIIQMRRLDLVAGLAAKGDLDLEQNRIVMSWISEMSSDLIVALVEKEQALKSLYERGH